MERVAIDGYTRTLLVCGPGQKFNATTDEEPFDFPGRAPRELYGDRNNLPRFAEIAAHYGLSYKGGGERIATLVSPSPDNLGKGGALDLELRLAGITSVDVEAAKAGSIKDDQGKPLKNPFYNLAVIGATFTSDRKLMVGERGRRFGAVLTPDRITKMGDACWALAPSGGATFVYDQDPVDYTIRAEAGQELGLKPEELKGVSGIGIFNALKIGPTGVKIVVGLQAGVTSEELIDRHLRARTAYEKSAQSGLDKGAIAQRLIDGGHAPDVWEHTRLIGIPVDSESIRDFVNKAVVDYNPNQLVHTACGIGVGALELLAEYLERNPSA